LISSNRVYTATLRGNKFVAIAVSNAKSVLVVFSLVLVTLAGCSAQLGATSSDHPKSFEATVTHVVDGDTIDVRYANGSTERVRLLGIDTPEVHVAVQPGEYEGVPDTDAGRACLRAAGENASAVLVDRLADERVKLELDPEADVRGGYGRLLAIVVHENSSVNLDLIQVGHARLYDTAFSERDRYAQAEQMARDANRGLWQCQSAR
jgi:micrococcal nuclease